MDSPNSELPDRFDVLVVGAGAAGMYAALCLPERLQVGLITKDDLPLSASDWAQGGLAAAIAPEDSPQLHVDDTLKAGAGLCDLEAVEFLAERAPECVRSLAQLGVAFDRHGNQLALTLEAAHSKPRVLHAADTTGRAVVSTLSARVRERSNIRVLSQANAIDLWSDENTGQCRGISIIYGGRLRWIRAGAIVLATGGGGQVFAQTTNPSVSTGDGVAMAWRAGGVLRDLEFFQFHPTALTVPGAPRFLISEAVRGEGAHLTDDRGYRFAFDYHPSGDLAPRDVVSRAIFHYLQKTGADPTTGRVWLDLRPIGSDRVRYRFPNIIRVCRRWDIDVFEEPVPVAPAAHYWMGGIATDLDGQTSIPGVYAVGETASTGVHGANRLASNSLLECLVFGAQLAQLQLPESREVTPSPLEPELAGDRPFADWSSQWETIQSLRRDLPIAMWQGAGISRQQSLLDETIARVERMQARFNALPVSRYLQSLEPGRAVDFNRSQIDRPLRVWGETRNLLAIALLILKSAAFRTESRGGHYRADYPKSRSQWQGHTLIQHNRWWLGSPSPSPASE